MCGNSASLCGEDWEGKRRRTQSLPVRGISLEHAHAFFLPCRFVFELALSSSHVSISAKQLNGEVNLRDSYK